MKIIKSPFTDAYKNLSLEEVILKDPEMTGDILLIYINDNAVIIGRNQNAHEEINSFFLKENSVKLVRRVSGGGAVYHDHGNINFSFITDRKRESLEKFLEPIISFLKSLGLDAKFKGKNDIAVYGMKISGNAQYIYKERMFHHGTLLFNTDLSVLGKALNVNKLKLESKGIKSARQSVSNIKDLLKDEMSEKEFETKLIEFFVGTLNAELVSIDKYKEDEIKALINVRSSYDWIYGKNPKFNIRNEKRFDGGTIGVFLFVEQNKIESIEFFGDYLSNNDFENISEIFTGKIFKDEEIINIVNGIEGFENYFGKIERNELISLLLGE